MVWVWLTQQMKSDLGSPRWSWRGHGKHDWFNGDCQGGNENWMGFSVALEPHHMMLQVFSHVNKPDRAFWQMKSGMGEEKWDEQKVKVKSTELRNFGLLCKGEINPHISQRLRKCTHLLFSLIVKVYELIYEGLHKK